MGKITKSHLTDEAKGIVEAYIEEGHKIQKAVKLMCDDLGISYNGSKARIYQKIYKALKEDGGHEALKEECEAIGIPLNDVNYYWHKSQRFSLNVSNKKQDHIKEFNEYLEHLKKSLSNKFFWPKKFNHDGGDKLLVPSIFDLHLGKLAWGVETGEDYDIKIASERFKTALEDLIKKTSGNKYKRILFPVGNDIYNSDKALPFAQTTSGTPQHDDARWQKMFKMGIELITQAAIRLAEIAPVDIVTVFSNHDHERVFYLGEVLTATFYKHPCITVDNSPKVRKYYKFGCNLLGLAHGHNEKPDLLPLLMAQEASKDWGDTWYREWLLGHLHHKKQLLSQGTKDYNGVKVTYLTSPSSADAWHASRGFVGAIKGAEAFVYDAEEGLVMTATHNIK